MVTIFDIMGLLACVSSTLILIGFFINTPDNVSDLLFGNVVSLTGMILGFGVIILFAFELSRTRKD